MSTLPDYPEALSAALTCAAALGRAEEVDLARAVGRVLIEPLTADRDLPPFDRAQMDGYALRAAEVGTVEAWPVNRTIAAGASAEGAVPPGECVAIATGAPVPADVDTIIQHELSDRGNPVRFEIDTVKAGKAVHPRGADAHEGDVIVDGGTRLGAHHVGIAAAVGRARLTVAERPRVVVLSSGDEVIPVEEAPLPHQIRNSNGPQVGAMLEAAGAAPASCRHVRDDLDSTITAVGAALADADIVVTIGGISAGDRDFLPDAFDAHRVERAVAGARIQPGKPVIVGRSPSGAVVVALPGNPVSTLACGCLFAWPIILMMLGLDPALPWRTAELGEPVRPNAKRRAFRPATRTPDDRVIVPSWAGSGDLAHTARTDGLLELPVQPDAVAAGARLRFLPWPWS